MALRGVTDTYAIPLKKLSSLTDEEHEGIFGGIETLAERSEKIAASVSNTLHRSTTRSINLGTI